ncbi:putative methyltransferase-domain-containing protein [Mycena albidolilacea]|uniref:Methyltransferase-domain-containing protein n=1 Tax=Mycena albidolilacea TaxID=1033008 RepID=A0AAD6ZQ25_9AGAR|nr:putative methyltransferase-domain-containing protein [Mycena albidolilacea]
MFFYISFLRPPPTSCSNTLSITPQIANDLRTELYEGVQDIYYSWLSMTTGAETKPVKLTTWRGQSSAYKEIPVPLPRSAANGTWRLVLGSGPSSSSVRLDAVSILPLGVMSMPILLGKPQSSKSKAKLQDQIERVYTFGENKTVRISEQTSFDLDKASHALQKKIWDSGIGLSSWLIQCPPSFLSSPEPLRILELGAGTGIVSVVLGALRPEDRIIATDVESAMPLLQHNITANNSPVEAAVLDWDEEELPQCVQECGAFDIIVMADVTYNTASFPSLVRSLKKLVNLSPKRPRVLLGYKERDSGERALWGMAEEAGITLQQVGQIPGGGGMAVEIWEAAGGQMDATTVED